MLPQVFKGKGSILKAGTCSELLQLMVHTCWVISYLNILEIFTTETNQWWYDTLSIYICTFQLMPLLIAC